MKTISLDLNQLAVTSFATEESRPVSQALIGIIKCTGCVSGCGILGGTEF